MNRNSLGMLAVAWTLAGSNVSGADLFDGNSLGAIKAGDPVAAADTIGGYAIYPGDGRWTFDQGKADLVVGHSTMWMGKATLTHRQDGHLVAWQNITANLSRSLDSAGWRGGPCGSEHLFKAAGRSGSSETCLTIDPAVNSAGTRRVLYFGVGITHGAARGRYQHLYLALNAEVFGFRDMGPGDWTTATLEANPRRREFIERLKAWAETLQTAAGKAFEKGEAGDFYAGAPSYMTLMQVPQDLQGGDFSLGFIGAVEDLKNKQGFKAIAYSKTGPGSTRWTNAWSQPTQQDADKRALDGCERDRAASRPPCQLYPAK